MRKPAVNRGCGRPAPESPAVRGFCPRGRKQAAYGRQPTGMYILMCILRLLQDCTRRRRPHIACGGFFCKKAR